MREKVKAVVTELVSIQPGERENRVLEALIENPQDPITTVLRRAGLKPSDLDSACTSGAFIDDIFDKSLRKIVGPLIPKVLFTLANGAADGNDAKLKLLMQLLDKLKPDQTVNLNFENHTDHELQTRLELLMREFNGPQEIN